MDGSAAATTTTTLSLCFFRGLLLFDGSSGEAAAPNNPRSLHNSSKKPVRVTMGDPLSLRFIDREAFAALELFVTYL